MADEMIHEIPLHRRWGGVLGPARHFQRSGNRTLMFEICPAIGRCGLLSPMHAIFEAWCKNTENSEKPANDLQLQVKYSRFKSYRFYGTGRDLVKASPVRAEAASAPGSAHPILPGVTYLRPVISDIRHFATDPDHLFCHAATLRPDLPGDVVHTFPLASLALRGNKNPPWLQTPRQATLSAQKI